MKSLVVSAMICAATVGTSVANPTIFWPTENVKKEHVRTEEDVAAFKQAIAFHQHNVDVLFNQFELGRQRLRKSRGNHADLQRDKAFFIGAYQNDIDQGIRVAASKKAIAEIEAVYAAKHEARDAYEAAQMATLKEQLRAELKREQKQFKKAKRKYADFINEETLPLLRRAEQYFAEAIDAVNHIAADYIAYAVR